MDIDSWNTWKPTNFKSQKFISQINQTEHQSDSGGRGGVTLLLRRCSKSVTSTWSFWNGSCYSSSSSSGPDLLSPKTSLSYSSSSILSSSPFPPPPPPPSPSPSYCSMSLPPPSPPASPVVNLSEFYSYRLIGKLTAFLQIQEFCQRNQIVDSSTTTARLFLLSSNLGLEIFSSSLYLSINNKQLNKQTIPNEYSI